MKIVKIYKLTDIEKQEEDSLKYWASKSIKEKTDAILRTEKTKFI